MSLATLATDDRSRLDLGKSNLPRTTIMGGAGLPIFFARDPDRTNLAIDSGTYVGS